MAKNVIKLRVKQVVVETAADVAAREWVARVEGIVMQLSEGAITYRECANALIARTCEAYDSLPMSDDEAQAERDAYAAELHDNIN